MADSGSLYKLSVSDLVVKEPDLKRGDRVERSLYDDQALRAIPRGTISLIAAIIPVAGSLA